MRNQIPRTQGPRLPDLTELENITWMTIPGHIQMWFKFYKWAASTGSYPHGTWLNGAWEVFSGDCAQDGVVWHEEKVEREQSRWRDKQWKLFSLVCLACQFRAHRMLTVNETVNSQLPCEPTESETSACVPCPRAPHINPSFWIFLAHVEGSRTAAMNSTHKTRRSGMSFFHEWPLTTLSSTASFYQPAPRTDLIFSYLTLKSFEYQHPPPWSMSSPSLHHSLLILFHTSSFPLHATYHGSSKIYKNR